MHVDVLFSVLLEGVLALGDSNICTLPTNTMFCDLVEGLKIIGSFMVLLDHSGLTKLHGVQSSSLSLFLVLRGFGSHNSLKQEILLRTPVEQRRAGIMRDTSTNQDGGLWPPTPKRSTYQTYQGLRHLILIRKLMELTKGERERGLALRNVCCPCTQAVHPLQHLRKRQVADTIMGFVALIQSTSI